jgi:hypothetical protein
MSIVSPQIVSRENFDNTPCGRALYQMLGVFSELEREMIVAIFLALTGVFEFRAGRRWWAGYYFRPRRRPERSLR